MRRSALLLLPLLASFACRTPDATSARKTDTTAGEMNASDPHGATAVSAPHSFRVFVSNEVSNDIAVIDGQRDELVTRVAIGKRPRGLRVSPDGKRLYVAVSGSPRGGPGVDESKLPAPDRAADGIAVFDIQSWTLLYTLASGPDPESFDLTRDGRTLFVSNEDAATLSVVDVERRKIVATVPVGGEPEGVTLSPDNTTVWVTSEADSQVFVVDTRTLKVVAKVPVGSRPRSILFSLDGTRAWVTGENAASVLEIDARAFTPVRTIHIEGDFARPMGLALSPDGRTLYVSNGRGTSVSLVDVATGTVKRRADKIGLRPWGIGVSPDGFKVYAANGPSNDATVLDANTGEVLKRIAVGESPWGVAISR